MTTGQLLFLVLVGEAVAVSLLVLGGQRVVDWWRSRAYVKAFDVPDCECSACVVWRWEEAQR
jgi:hypothetical protein